VDGATGRRCSLVHVEVAGTSPECELGQRLLTVEQAIEAAINEFKPEVVAVERVFSQHNVRTVMGTAQASAIAAVAAARAGLSVALHTPSEVKAAVTGNGRADKAQVGAMITRILSLKELPRPADAADAIAIAVCHLWRAPTQNRINAALARTRMMAKGGRSA
jgi:crossover junction endodeoxyribonuclease RuvC